MCRPRINVSDEHANRVFTFDPKRADEVMNPRGKPKATPCASCPYRVANRDGVTGHGERWDVYFRGSTLEAVWQGTFVDPEHGGAPEDGEGLRNGQLNGCHMTHDHPCAGALVLQQRELLRWHKRAQGSRWPYGLGTDNVGLTMKGVRMIAARLLNRGERPDRCPAWLAFEHREILQFVMRAEKYGSRRAWSRYEYERPDGLTLRGLRQAAARLGYTPFQLAAMSVHEVRALLDPRALDGSADGIPPTTVLDMSRETLLDRAHPAISDPAIGIDALGPPLPGEFEQEPAA